MRILRLHFPALLLCWTSTVFAHDMWIEASSFAAQPGELLTVSLKVGHPGKGVEPVARNPARIARFAAISGEQETPVLGRDGKAPAGLLRTPAPGLLTLLYGSNTARSELPADRFAAYLAEEGLSSIATLRSERGQDHEPGRERYSRYLKALVNVGGGRAEPDRWRGLTLELVAETNPSLVRPGDLLAIRLLFQGQPLAGTLIEAFALDGDSPEASAISDRAGRVELKLERAGSWAIAATHMVALPAGADADWESFWTSLTFSSSPPLPH